MSDHEERAGKFMEQALEGSGFRPPDDDRKQGNLGSWAEPAGEFAGELDLEPVGPARSPAEAVERFRMVGATEPALYFPAEVDEPWNADQPDEDFPEGELGLLDRMTTVERSLIEMAEEVGRQLGLLRAEIRGEGVPGGVAHAVPGGVAHAHDRIDQVVNVVGRALGVPLGGI